MNRIPLLSATMVLPFALAAQLVTPLKHEVGTTVLGDQGGSVQLDGDFLLVSNQRGAILYERCTNTGWLPIWTAPDLAGVGGVPIAEAAMDADHIVVGYPSYPNSGGMPDGAVAVFDRQTLSLTPVTLLTPQYATDYGWGTGPIRHIGNYFLVSLYASTISSISSDYGRVALLSATTGVPWVPIFVDDPTPDPAPIFGYRICGSQDYFSVIDAFSVRHYSVSAGTVTSIGSDNMSPFQVWSLDMKDDVLAVGLYDTNPGTFTQRVELFDLVSNQWTNSSTINTQGAFQTQAIYALSLDDDMIAVGDVVDNGFTGAVHLFQNIAGDWDNYVTTIFPIEPSGGGFDWYGYSLDLQGDILAAGSPLYLDGSDQIGAFDIYQVCREEEDLELVLFAMGGTNATSWEVIDVATSGVVESGGPYTPTCGGAPVVESFSLPCGCYRLNVYDADNTICTGGYVLRTVGGSRIIDASANAAFTSPSHISNSGSWCLPIGDIALTAGSCDLLNVSRATWLEWEEDCEVAANCAATVDPTTTGYQIWIYDPHGTYQRLNFFSNSNLSRGPSPPSGTCGAIQFGRVSGFQTSPVPLNTDLNIRVRPRVSDLNKAWGPACRLRYNSAFDGGSGSSMVIQDNPVLRGTQVIRVTFIEPSPEESGLVAPTDRGHGLFRCFDVTGRAVATSSSQTSGDVLELTFQDELRSGLYVLEYNIGSNRTVARFVVQ